MPSDVLFAVVLNITHVTSFRTVNASYVIRSRTRCSEICVTRTKNQIRFKAVLIVSLSIFRFRSTVKSQLSEYRIKKQWIMEISKYQFSFRSFCFYLIFISIKYECEIIRVEAICAPIATNIIEILLINFTKIVI